MTRIRNIKLSAIAIMLLAAVSVVAIACSADTENSTDSGFGLTQEQAGDPRGDPGSDSSGSVFDSGFGGRNPAAATAVPRATPSPPPPSIPGSGPGIEEDGDFSPDSGNPSPSESPLEQQVAQVSSNRVIIRIVDMSIETTEIASTIEQIGNIATREGGWAVRTQNVEVHRGSIDIRVPADRLDSVLVELRNLAENVVSEVSTSQDFTEEFTDTTSRIQTLQDTVDALRALFTRADEIEDALEIQREITRIQSDIEAMQARINFLSESAAFSLVRISVLALPQEMVIDAGPDKLAAVGRTVRFRAEFTPPEGIENFNIEWDFGDGSRKQVVSAVAPVDVEGRVISAPVVHTYSDEEDSPYIVKVIVTGTGESGAAEGEDVQVVTVNRVAPIEVFAGDNRVVESGEEINLRASFTRPDGVESLEYTWDFGDGSAPVTVDAPADATVAEIKHTYANSRPQSYNVAITVKGETPSGSTEGTGSLQILVEEPEGIAPSGFTPGESAKSATRALSAIAAGIGTAAIWIGILSPIWIVIGIIAYVLYRNNERNRNRRTSQRLAVEARQQETIDQIDP